MDGGPIGRCREQRSKSHPAFSGDERSRAASYSAEDTLDKVSPADLRQAMTVLAMASFFLADAHDIPRGHFTPAQTAATLIQGKQKPMLEVFGLWPF